MAVSKRKCPFCKTYNKPEEGLLIKGRLYCDMNCAVSYGKKNAPKAKAKQEKSDRVELTRKKRTLKDNDRKRQFKLTKEVIQKWVHRVRDAGKPCISCETTNPNIIYSGGHYRTAGGNPEIALETRNIHRQCLFNCNKNKSGNISGDKHSIGFKQGLINRYGQDYVDWLDGYHESNRLDCEQLKQLRAYYNKLIRENKKTDEDRPFF
ncbi:hypothetical protein KKJFFJLC_00052 [Vibrio phage vB_VpaS_PGB]|nr:hypothetical protein HHKILHMN_00045 [Vibrio phage vB_VpaS_PGA]WVH05595.1 hypothetical protein KKJFFJLC_00052 [Vibrio phage vB_VpaS_PGB]